MGEREPEKNKEYMQKRRKRNLLRELTFSLSLSCSHSKPWRTCTESTAQGRIPPSYIPIALFVPLPFPWRTPASFVTITQHPHHTRCVRHEATKPLQLHEVNLLCSALLFHFRTSTTHHTIHPPGIASEH